MGITIHLNTNTNNLEEIVSSKMGTIVEESIEFEKNSLLADIINQIERPLLKIVLSSNKMKEDSFFPTTIPTSLKSPFILLNAFANL